GEEALTLLRSAAHAAERKTDTPAESATPPPASMSESDQAEAQTAATDRQKSADDVPPAPLFKLPEGGKVARLEALRRIVLEDSWCRSQVKPGKQVVFGVGSPDARIFFCGEA